MTNDFERQTVHIRRWVDHDGVPSVPLASELLAWYHYVTGGLDPDHIITVVRNASELLADFYEDDDDD